MHRFRLMVCLLLVTILGFTGAVQAQTQLKITLKNNNQTEQLAQEELERLLKTYDLSPYFFTSEVVIERFVVPHSHPVLTLNTRDVGRPLLLLTTFLHEQIHRSLSDWPDRARATEKAIEELNGVFPNVPVGRPYGAKDQNSTYLHLIVCWLELQALESYIGDPAARRVLVSETHYRWIYATVLSNVGEKVGEIARKHGLDQHPSLTD